MEHDTVIFEFGCEAGGDASLCYLIEKVDNEFIFSRCADGCLSWMTDLEFVLPQNEIIALQKYLAPVSKWKRGYEPKDLIFDGFSWYIYYKYKDTLIKSSGYEKCPRNYGSVTKDLQSYIERLCSKYAENVQQDGIKDRIKFVTYTPKNYSARRFLTFDFTGLFKKK